MKNIKIKTFRDKEVEVPVYFPKPRGSAWERKAETKNCIDCESFISKTEAIPVIERLKELQSEWTPPEESKIKGICIFFDFPRILVASGDTELNCDFKKQG